MLKGIQRFDRSRKIRWRRNSDNQIYNIDKAGLLFKMTPDKTLKFEEENCTSGKYDENKK